MSRALAAFAVALSYFTIFPLGRGRREAPDALAISFLPLIGGLVGALAGGAGLLVWTLSHAVIWSALTAWIVSVALTGAVHVDGFLDSCDGLFVEAPPARRREILRDPRHGTFALVGMAMLSLVWVAAIASLDPRQLPWLLALTEGLSRGAALANAWLYPYAGAGVPPAFRRRPNLTLLATSALATAALAWSVAASLLWLLAIVPLASLGLARLASRRLGGGLSGDVYGALIAVGNVIGLTAAAAIVR